MPVRLHLVIALFTLAVLSYGAYSAAENLPRMRAVLLTGTANLTIEHAESVSVDLEYVQKNGQALLVLKHTGTSGIALSVPTSWQHSKFFNVSPDKVQTKQSGTTTRWRLPANSGLSFQITSPPKHLIVHDESSSPLQLTVIKADLLDGTADKEIYLLQGSSVQVW